MCNFIHLMYILVIYEMHFIKKKITLMYAFGILKSALIKFIKIFLLT